MPDLSFSFKGGSRLLPSRKRPFPRASGRSAPRWVGHGRCGKSSWAWPGANPMGHPAADQAEKHRTAFEPFRANSNTRPASAHCAARPEHAASTALAIEYGVPRFRVSPDSARLATYTSRSLAARTPARSRTAEQVAVAALQLVISLSLFMSSKASARRPP